MSDGAAKRGRQFVMKASHLDAILDEFTLGYFKAMLWTSCPLHHEGDEECERGGCDGSHGVDAFSRDARREVIEECRQFQEDCGQWISDGDEERAGVDFWLTRNRYGAGFWDGDWPREAGRALSEVASIWGSVDLYEGLEGIDIE